MSQVFDRFVPLQGCINFRDLGGYPTRDGRTVKWRRLFRSDAIHHMTPDDVRYVQQSLGLATIVDLRNTDEAKRDGRGPMAEASVEFYCVPFLEERGNEPPSPSEDPVVRLGGIYQWIFHNSGGLIAKALSKLAADGSLPAVFHCTAGKDRTGILAALILSLLGVDDEEIMGDYLLTNQRLDQLFERLKTLPGSENRPRESFAAPAKVMEQFLTKMNSSHGDATNYVRTHGVTEVAIAGLKASLLE